LARIVSLHFSPHIFTQWLTHYGSGALFLLLAFGIFGLPIPDETLLVFAGLLIAKGHLSAYKTIPAAYLGAATGISLSYFLGYTAGQVTIRRYGRWIGLTTDKLIKAHHWFEKVGKWLLLFGYYIPGVRHFSGIIAGTTYLTYWEFALFAYTGAILWSSTFLAIGYFGFNAWQHFHLF